MIGRRRKVQGKQIEGRKRRNKKREVHNGEHTVRSCIQIIHVQKGGEKGREEEEKEQEDEKEEEEKMS